ncbi:MAG: TIM barrel protein, partial [Victivallales bacterium]|nr:TIM barrel protein [Victivallales bacterium]
MRIGLKLWSLDVELIDKAAELAKNGVFDFLELYVAMGSFETLDEWRRWNGATVLHAAHSHGGLNMALPNVLDAERRYFDELDAFRIAMNSKNVVFHPGVNGRKEDATANFAEVRTMFPELGAAALLENKPLLGLNGEICVGASPEDVGWIVGQAEIGVCLDFGHAIAAANSLRLDWRVMIEKFLALNPVLFHLSDGYRDAEMDSHLNLSAGDYPIAEIAAMLPES